MALAIHPIMAAERARRTRIYEEAVVSIRLEGFELDEEVKALKIKYFDTVPVAASLCILKSGFLFVASEFGNSWVSNSTANLLFS